MPHIIVDDEQARIILQSAENIEIRDRNGKHLGYVARGFTDEDIAIARKRMASDQPRYTTQQVLDHIRSLEQK
jgi:hypothetical protein